MNDPDAPRSLGLTLWRQTWPMGIGVLSLLGFQLVDSAFIERPVTHLSAVLPNYRGLGIAIAALISRARSLHFLATTAKGKYWTIENSHNS